MEKEAVLSVLACYGKLFLILDCLAKPKYKGKCLVLKQNNMSYFVGTHGSPSSL